ncbi:MAG TPA: NDP-sugar synthase [bacterium]|nr:NDP-sugar synthase [bacterium]HQL61221.1 NDP-sugar synthase [bacterium]
MNTAAVILAAGQGKKMWPYGDTHPKAGLPIANRPLLDRTIEHLRQMDIDEIIVVCGHLCGQVREVTARHKNITCVDQPKPVGTADALLRAFSVMVAQQALVVYGDMLVTPADLQALLGFHERHPKDISLLVSGWNGEEQQAGIGVYVQDGKAVRIAGHPREECMRYCGIAVFPKSFEDYVKRNPGLMTSVEVGVMPPLEGELAQSIESYRKDGGNVHTLKAVGPIIDLDKPWHILTANRAWLDYASEQLKENDIHPSAIVHPDAEIDGHIAVGEGSVIGRGVKIKGDCWIGKNTQIIDGAIIYAKSSIGDNCKIREYCQIGDHTMIGHECVVGHCAEFAGVLMDGAYSYHYGEYWGVIGRSSDLGAATVCGTLRFDDQETIHRVRGRREIPTYGANASYLGDYVRTGVNAILMPGVKVGPYSLIGAGVILQEDVPNNSLIYVKQELVRKDWGPERYGW